MPTIARFLADMLRELTVRASFLPTTFRPVSVRLLNVVWFSLLEKCLTFVISLLNGTLRVNSLSRIAGLSTDRTEVWLGITENWFRFLMGHVRVHKEGKSLRTYPPK